MNEDDFNNFIFQNFRNYSNKDVFNAIKYIMDMKKKGGENIFEIGRFELEKAAKEKPGSLDEQTMKFYYL